MKSKCKLVGTDGNIFNLIGIARKTLREAGQRDKLEEMTNRVYETKSYDEALKTIMEYVDVEWGGLNG